MTDALSLVRVYNVRLSKIPEDERTQETKIEAMKQSLRIRSYLSFNQKQDLVKKVISQTITKADGRIIYNSCEKYIAFVNALLSSYTDLDVQPNTYDMLCSNDLLNLVVAAIGSEYELCLGVMEMYMSDLEAGRISLDQCYECES